MLIVGRCAAIGHHHAQVPPIQAVWKMSNLRRLIGLPPTVTHTVTQQSGSLSVRSFCSVVPIDTQTHKPAWLHRCFHDVRSFIKLQQSSSCKICKNTGRGKTIEDWSPAIKQQLETHTHTQACCFVRHSEISQIISSHIAHFTTSQSPSARGSL